MFSGRHPAVQKNRASLSLHFRKFWSGAAAEKSDAPPPSLLQVFDQRPPRNRTRDFWQSRTVRLGWSAMYEFGAHQRSANGVQLPPKRPRPGATFPPPSELTSPIRPDPPAPLPCCVLAQKRVARRAIP